MNEDLPNRSALSTSGADQEPSMNVATQDGAGIDRRKLLRRIDIRVLPILTIVYTLAFLDRVNIGNALLFRLPADLHLHAWQTNTALSVFFISYVVFEIPANILMKKVKPHIFLPLSMLVFGVLMTVQGFVKGFGGLVTTRFLMGIAEAGVFPGCFYLIGMWYKRLEAQKRFTFFFNAASMAAAFGGLLASAIGKMNGIRGYSAWRWIFILEGILTCVFSVIAFYVIPDFPENAKWVTKAERAFVIERLAADQGSSEIEKHFTWQAVMESFKDWKMIAGAMMYFGPTISAYSLAYFIPSIVSTYGYAPIEAQLHSVPPWAAAVVFGMLIAYLSDRFQHRFGFILIGLCLGIAGNLILFNVHDNRQVEYAGLVLYTMGVISLLPIVVCWFSLNLKGHRNRAVGTAWQIGFGNLAGIIAIFAFPSTDAPRYHLGYSLGLSFLFVGGAASTVYFVGCYMENKQPNKRIRLIL